MVRVPLRLRHACLSLSHQSTPTTHCPSRLGSIIHQVACTPSTLHVFPHTSTTMPRSIAKAVAASLPYLFLSTLVFRPADAVFDHDRDAVPHLAVIPSVILPEDHQAILRPFPLQPQEHEFVRADDERACCRSANLQADITTYLPPRNSQISKLGTEIGHTRACVSKSGG